MRFDTFESLAHSLWNSIPARYLQGIDGLRVVRRARAEPGHPGVWTLGECVTESYPSDFGGPETIRSSVVLYWGSFRRVAADDPDFDWDHEIRETLTHELRHHLESLAAEDALEDVDRAVEQNLKRLDGEPFDPGFYLDGERVPAAEAPAVVGRDATTWRVEGDWFVELRWDERAPPPDPLELRWHGSRWLVHPPAAPPDVLFLRLVEPFEPPPTDGPLDEVTLVLVRRTGFIATLAALLRRRAVTVDDVDAAVERAP